MLPYLPAAAAFRKRAADKGVVGRQVIDWQQALKQRWATLRFGEVKVESGGEQHVFDVQIYLDDLDPQAVAVELYAEGVNGDEPERQKMKRLRPLTGASGGYVYSGIGPCGPPGGGLYGPGDTALFRRGGSPGSRSHPVAAVIHFQPRRENGRKDGASGHRRGSWWV